LTKFKGHISFFFFSKTFDNYVTVIICLSNNIILEFKKSPIKFKLTQKRMKPIKFSVSSFGECNGPHLNSKNKIKNFCKKK